MDGFKAIFTTVKFSVTLHKNLQDLSRFLSLFFFNSFTTQTLNLTTNSLTCCCYKIHNALLSIYTNGQTKKTQKK